MTEPAGTGSRRVPTRPSRMWRYLWWPQHEDIYLFRLPGSEQLHGQLFRL